MRHQWVLRFAAGLALTAGVFGPDNLLSSSVHTLMDGIGQAFSWFVVAFLYGWLCHSSFVKPVDPFLSTTQMPQLRPVPIPTKGRRFPAQLLVWLFEHRRWTLDEDWSFELLDRGKPVTIILNKGFDFDGASIPRVFWTVLSPVGLLLIPGLIHDYGYKYDRLWQAKDGVIEPYQAQSGKSHWDDLFWRVGNQVNGLWLLNSVAWFAIVAGGWRAWNLHRKRARDPEEARPTSTGRSTA